MRYLSAIAVASVSWGLWGASAHAQIESHDFRLSLDAAIVSWTKHVATYDDFGTEYEQKYEVTNVGFLGAGNIGVGFAATRYLIPTLSFGLQQIKYESEESSTETLRQWELRPALEVAILPSWRLVPFASAGLSLVRQLSKDDDPEFPEDTKVFGVGPAISAGLHGFVVEHASLDVSLTYRALFYGDPDTNEEVDSEDLAQSRKDHAVLLNLGASFWI